MGENSYPTRLNYYNGLFLQASDFTTEQQYGMDMLGYHNQYIHQALGVASGLTLSVKENSVTNNGNNSSQWIITIAAGFAQCQVNEANTQPYCTGLLLPDELSTTAPEAFNNSSSFYVTLTYQTIKQNMDQDKGPDYIHIVEQPKVGFSSQSPGSDKSLVILGKVTVAPGQTPQIDYQEKSFIYDINTVFGITSPGYDQYNLVLNGNLAANGSLSVGNPGAISSMPPGSALKVSGGIYADSLTATAQINCNGALTAESATFTGSSLDISNGNITAKSIVVNDSLTTTDLTINNNFAVNNTFTANGGITIPSGDLKIETGNLNVSQGSVSVAGDLSGNNLTLTNAVNATQGTSQFKALNINESITVNTADINSTLNVGALITGSQGLNLKGNATFNDNIQATDISASGYLTVDQNITVTNKVTTKNLEVTQGVSVAENIIAKGNISAASFTTTGTFNSNQVTADTSLASQGGAVIRDFHKFVSWDPVNSPITFDIASLNKALKTSSLMYRIVIEGCSDLGSIQSELSGMLQVQAPTELNNPHVNNQAPGAVADQSIQKGNLTITVKPGETNNGFQWLGFTASLWMFIDDGGGASS
ncbi:hypothetical protein BTA51_09375 [Hahella sp. CCB-MM4]|uniref:hypothetical protein n=1 Tax=Hahella sp. (strain CCB-MM4) TaxID=1926491 RepID=UPI000B9A7E9C|nr:hypothetical protein [Hahella sp. CCB-MM4]OZG73980.1 hypothetical protein BTA51_09375 [Hahella sp. CCB-MM4]